jgi:hypothetical protein
MSNLPRQSIPIPDLHPLDQDVPLSEQLERLSSAIQLVLQASALKSSYEEHYRYCYNLCLRQKVFYHLFCSYGLRSVITQGPPCFSISFAQGSDLYERVRLLISSHILAQFDERILPLLPQPPITPSSSAPISSTSSPGLSGGKARGGGPFVDEALTSERKLWGQAFLEVVEAVWEDHKRAVQKVSSVLKYMVSP